MIWKELQATVQPFFVLAPMDDVTDIAFRQLVTETAPPHLLYTEFISADGMQSDGREAVTQKIAARDEEKSGLIAQIWGLQPHAYYQTAKELISDGFAGIDINMGCPVKNVISKGACSALINNRPLVEELISATKDGIAAGAQAAGAVKNPAFSVKIRIGFNRIATEEWTEYLLQQGMDALIVHGRTTKEMSKVPNHWEEIALVPAIRDKVAPDTVVVGNGDVLSLEEGKDRAVASGVDGIMIARGIFSDPFIFDKTHPTLQPTDRIKLYLRHIELFEQYWGAKKNPAGLKKFAKMYLREFDGAKELREAIMNCTNTGQMQSVLDRGLLH